MKFAHIINPVKANENAPNYLYYAQPITFKSIIKAKEMSKEDVDIYCINFEEDDVIIPTVFKKLPHLTRSIQSEYGKEYKKLPFIGDIINQDIDCDYIIYTNVDICIQPHFYNKIARIMKKYDACIINRRDGIPKFLKNKRLTVDDLDKMYEYYGKDHEGYDCFIFKKNKLDLGNIFLGYPHGDTVFMLELYKNYEKFTIFKDLHITFHIGEDKAWKIFNQKDTELLITNLKHLKLLFSVVPYNVINLRYCRKMIDEQNILPLLEGEIDDPFYIEYKKWYLKFIELCQQHNI